MVDTTRTSSPEIGTAAAGVAAAVGAFALWGVFPLYWAQLAAVPPLEVMWHRVLWGGLLSWVIVFVGRRDEGRRRGRTVALVPRGRPARLLVLNGALLGVNWFVYVWAVSAGRTLDASLGYYINPLVNVVFGMLFFRERLTGYKWVALAFAATGVGYMALQLTTFPWVSLTLAGTFGLYGVIKKKTALSSIHGLALELTPVMVLAAAMIGYGIASRTGTFAVGDARTTGLLVGTSAVTVAPLLLFGVAARRIPLGDVGFLQYIAPTLMLLIAVFVFGETVEPARRFGFLCVWIGLSIYTAGTLRGRKKYKKI